MSAPSTWWSAAGRRSRWLCLIGACLFACHAQAGSVTDTGTQQQARDKTFELLRRAQDEAGRSQDYFPQAWAQIQRGLQQTRNDPLQYGQWLRARWLYFLLQDDHRQARDALEEALQKLTAAHADADLVAKFMSDLSYSLILLGEVARAKEYLRRAVVLANQQGNREWLADLYYSLGDAYRKTGERMVAHRYFEAAYEIDRTGSDASMTSASELKLGSLARDAGNYAEAVRLHQRALDRFRRTGEYRQLVTEIELARDHAARGERELAEQYAQRALNDKRSLLDQRLDANILLLRVSNDRRAAGTSKPTDAESAAALVHNIEALLDRFSTPQKSALARPTHRLQFAAQAIRHYALNRDLGKVAMHGNAAIQLARRVANDLRATNDDSLAWLTEAQPALNEHVKALYALDRKQVYPLLESYYGQLTGPGALRHAGVVGRAFEVHAVELFERYRMAEQRLVDATAEVERLQLYADATARLRAAQLQAERRSRERDLARDAYLTIYRAQPMAPLPQDTASYAPPPIPRSDIFIRYFVQEEVSFGIALAGQDVEYFDLPPRSTVLKLVQRALDTLQTPGGDGTERTTLSSLARLLPPREFLSRHANATRLVIAADDAMQPLPFGAIDLALPAQRYTPLIERFETVRTKSAARYYASQSNGTSASTDIVVFANPALGASPIAGVQLRKAPMPRWVDRLFSLPGASKEADSVTRAFPTRVSAYVGGKATNDVLLSPAVRAAGVLHIATHGYFSKALPDIVGLATAGSNAQDRSGGGFLGITELFMEPLSSRLVVVSGCDTMRGKDYSGWGVRSLADGFLTQGAGSVVGTLWNVSDIATATLMDGFYRALSRSNGNSSAALRTAQRELADSALYSDPYFWAGVVLESSNRSVDQQAL